MEEKLCEYGCGKIATHQLKNGKWICSNSPNSCPVNKKNNSIKHIGNPGWNHKSRKKIKCLHCNEFYDYSVINKHKDACSKNPHNIKKQNLKENTLLVCKNCGKIYIRKNGTNNFCSRKCAYIRKINENTKEKIRNSLFKIKCIEYRLCVECNTSFSVLYTKNRKNTKQFCSRKCVRIFNNKHQHPTSKRKLAISETRKYMFKNGILLITGGTTKWLPYKDFKVQGTYELRTCEILDRWKEENLIKDWIYTNDRISYIGKDNKSHTYLLDFKVFRNDNSWYYLEVKGWKRLNDDLKWKAVRDKGYELIIWFNEDIFENEAM